MIWEITLLLTCFSVLTISPRAGQYFPGESSCSNKIAQSSRSSGQSLRANEIPQEFLEELYDVDIVQFVNGMPTLLDHVFDDNDVKLLTTECDVDEDCLNNKKVSVKKYHQKMQEIQCNNGLYVSKVLDKLKSSIVNMKNKNTSISSLREKVKEYLLYLSSMLTLLKLAQWNAYAWQIEIFTYLSGLGAMYVNIRSYVEHHENHYVSMRQKVLGFIDQCVQHNYLLSLTNTAIEESAIFQFVESIYKNNEVLNFPRQFYTVPSLMLQHLYSLDDFIFRWSVAFEIELDTSNVNSYRTRKQLGVYCSDHLIHKWALDPIGGSRYHIMVAKYIHLKAEYVAWFHLYTYHTILDQLLDITVGVSDYKRRVISSWKTLAPELKCVLRAVGLNENIYWSSINIMMVDLNKISKEDLAAREKFTRNLFCQSVEDLGLASASNMNRQLQKLKIANNYGDIFNSIQINVRYLARFHEELDRTSYPFKDSFIGTLLGAEGNETFVMR